MSAKISCLTYVETAEDAALKKMKDKDMARMKLLRADPDNVYYTLSVPVFEQINGYYCGPATVKQVIHYFNGSSSSQGTYATALGTTASGTTMTNIPGVVNAAIGSKWTYVYDSIGTKSNWAEKIIYNTSMSKPVILDITTNNVSAFPYNSAGHFVNTSGVDYRVLSSGTSQKIRITDPYGPGLGNIWYNEADLYKANSDHFRQAFIR